MTDVAAGGRWVANTFSDGTIRHDWVPDDQPPSPDGASGLWYVVGESGQPGRWEWRADGISDPATLPLPPVAQPPAYHPPAPQTSPDWPTSARLYQPPVAAGARGPTSSSWASPPPEPTKKMRKRVLQARRQPVPARTSGRGRAPLAPGEKRPGEISNRTAIISIVAALAVLAGVVLVFSRSSDDDAPNVQTVTLGPAQEGSDSTNGPTTNEPTAGAPEPDRADLSGADLNFPKTSGQWKLYTITVERDKGTGKFAGKATIQYNGNDAEGAAAQIVIRVVQNGNLVARLLGMASAVHAGEYATITLTSEEPWVQPQDGFTFEAI